MMICSKKRLLFVLKQAKNRRTKGAPTPSVPRNSFGFLAFSFALPLPVIARAAAFFIFSRLTLRSNGLYPRVLARNGDKGINVSCRANNIEFGYGWDELFHSGLSCPTSPCQHLRNFCDTSPPTFKNFGSVKQVEIPCFLTTHRAVVDSLASSCFLWFSVYYDWR